MRSEDYYREITDGEAAGFESLDPEQFAPCKGTILVVLPPAIAKLGNIAIPDAMQERPSYGRVASIPDDPNCPVERGQWVAFVQNCGRPIAFGGRQDLLLINYTDDVESEILGILNEAPVAQPAEV
jgi:hypothetical protein